jgi:mannose-1-phosphate guanylyltransferase
VIAVVLVGGEGTRLRPLTLDRPKPMLPIAGRPFLAHMLDRLAHAGVTRVIFSCGYLPDAIVHEFGRGGGRWPALEYVVEPEPRGTAGGVRFAAYGRVDGPFLALNGDVLAASDLSELLAFHREREARATLTLIGVEDPTRYGLVLRDAEQRVTSFLEKPSLSEAGPAPFWINAGAYALDPSVLDLVPADRAVSIEREVFPQLVGHGLVGWSSGGFWSDIGTPDSYLEANAAVVSGALGERLATVAPNAVVASDAVLREPYVVCAGARIESGAVVGPQAVIGAGAVVAERATLRDAVLHEGAQVGRGALVTDSVVGRHAAVGEGAELTAHSILGAGVVVDAGARLESARLSAEEVESGGT